MKTEINPKNINNTGEFGLINWIRKLSWKNKKTFIGIGDDAACIEIDRNRFLLATTDTLQEGIHLNLQWNTPESAGRKLVSVNISDIASMGGRAEWCLLTAGLNGKLSLKWFQSFMGGIWNETKKYGISIVGGDTVESPGKNYFSMTMMGTIEKNRVVLRSGAKPGDRIFVTGTTGDSSLGLEILKHYKNVKKVPEKLLCLVRKHLDPKPPAVLGRVLAEKGIPSAMIDISDGLIQDICHILDESGVGARVYANRIPLSSHYRKYVKKYSSDFFHMALNGGEDYELVFTASGGSIALLSGIKNKLRRRITEIGEITRSNIKLLVNPDGKVEQLKSSGYQHFNK
ncbi:MAG TPA: thiamine-phosphate kinase [bacterium]